MRPEPSRKVAEKLERKCDEVNVMEYRTIATMTAFSLGSSMQ